MPPARKYHHGDLRQALIDAALALLRAGGVPALTLRGAARQAGVSQAAPYRHFADHSDLLAAVAAESFRRLGGRMMAAARRPAPDRAGLRAVAQAYVRFGLQHPEEYRLMFASRFAAGGRFPELDAAAQSVSAMLEQGIRGLQDLKLVRAGDPATLAVTAWATMHGLVMLMLDEHASVAPVRSHHTLAGARLRVDAATEVLMFGMAPRRPGDGGGGPARGVRTEGDAGSGRR